MELTKNFNYIRSWHFHAPHYKRGYVLTWFLFGTISMCCLSTYGMCVRLCVPVQCGSAHNRNSTTTIRYGVVCTRLCLALSLSECVLCSNARAAFSYLFLFQKSMTCVVNTTQTRSIGKRENREQLIHCNVISYCGICSPESGNAQHTNVNRVSAIRYHTHSHRWRQYYSFFFWTQTELATLLLASQTQSYLIWILHCI